jgi:murein DD-endopeptidase MepM/ murein hydrolase activator NlpD
LKKWVFLFLILKSNTLFTDEIPFLENLEYENKNLIQLRSDITHNLKVSKSRSPQKDYIPIRFYRYRVIKGDNFFKIMTKTSTDIDTLSSVNSLSSPQDIQIGMVIYIPNMRGIYDDEDLPNTESSRERLAKKHNILPKQLVYESNYRNEWYIPGRTLGKVEKSYFYGLAFRSPIRFGRKTSDFGPRKDPFTKKKTFHGGIDIAAPKGTSVYSSAPGEVIYVGTKGGYGKLIVIKHLHGYETRYGHLEETLVEKGETIKKNKLIGKVGNTGRATGYHLHFEVSRNNKTQKPEFKDHK